MRTVKDQFCRPFVDLFHFVTHIAVFFFCGNEEVAVVVEERGMATLGLLMLPD